jgi:thiopeptide-type bacteriocin biosynthesis protein
LVIPVRIPSEHTQHIKPYTFTENVVIKKYLPGGTWLYLKIFASPNTIDKILKEYILSFVEQNVLEKNFECFFFIRFKENGNHLRIRFYNKDITKQQNVLNLLTAKLNFLIENEVITNIVTDTYVPEYERYGGVDLFELAEKIFAADSFATLRMLNLLDSESEDNFRIIFSMRSVDCLLNDFAYTIDDKIKLLKSLAEGFFNEFGANASLKKNINSKYKNMHRTILSYMNLEKDAENEITELSNILSQRSKQNEDAIIQIFQILKKDRKRYMKDTLLSSYIHMLINRLFINHQRKYELVIYNFLERYYTSINSINNKK